MPKENDSSEPWSPKKAPKDKKDTPQVGRGEALDYDMIGQWIKFRSDRANLIEIPESPEAILRNSLSQREAQKREEKKKEALAAKAEEKKEAARRQRRLERLQRVDRSDSVDRQAFAVHDQVRTREFLEGANSILYDGKGMVLPVQGKEKSVEVASYPGGGYSAHTGGFYGTPQPQSRIGEYKYFDIAGYALISPDREGSFVSHGQVVDTTENKILFAGFVGVRPENFPPGYDDFLMYAVTNRNTSDSDIAPGIEYVLNDYDKVPFVTKDPGLKPPAFGSDKYKSVKSVRAALTDATKYPQAKKDFQKSLTEIIENLPKYPPTRNQQ
jgi:hypothetical protein